MAKAWVERGLKRAELFDKGQSKRIWAELYKVWGWASGGHGYFFVFFGRALTAIFKKDVRRGVLQLHLDGVLSQFWCR